jgi:hypothetical protein
VRRAILVLVLILPLACGDDFPEMEPEPSPPEPFEAPEPEPGLPEIPEGMLDVGPLLALIPKDPLLEVLPNAAFENLEELRESLRESGRRHVTPAEFDRAMKDLDEVRAHLHRLRTDRDYRRLRAWRTWVGVHPIWRNMRTDMVALPPWLVVHEVPPRRGERVEARRRAEAAAKRLHAVYEKFRTLLDPPISLPKLSDLTREEERFLKAFLCASEKSLRRYRQEIGMPSPVTVTYNPADQWLVGATGSEGVLRDLAAIELRQLLHVYRKVLIERVTGEEVLWTDPRTQGRAVWIEEGIAGLFPEASDEDEDLEEWVRMRDSPGWPLARMLNCTGWPDVTRLLAGLRSSEMRVLFALKARSFCRFLWSREDYRKKLLAYLVKDLHGRSGPEVFAKVWWGEEKGRDWKNLDWTVLDREFRAHVEKLVEVRKGK